MKAKIARHTAWIGFIHLVVILLLSACTAQNNSEPIHTAVTTETTIPKPKALSGIVLISGRDIKPFVTPIELRKKNTFSLYKTAITDAEGKFEILDIPSGDYELWVLITTEAKMVSGCEDLLVPNNQWRIGIKFQESNPIITKETSLQEALVGSQNFTAYELHPTGFYAVSPEFTIVSVFDEEIDITLSCK